MAEKRGNGVNGAFWGQDWAKMRETTERGTSYKNGKEPRYLWTAALYE